MTSWTYSGNLMDFYGLPSWPTCIYRTGDKWPTYQDVGWTWREPRETRPVYDKHLQDAWDMLHIDIYSFLDSMDVNWSTIDPVRFAEKKESEGESPIYLWIGVLPGSLSFGRAQDAAVGCQKILRTAGFPDIEVSFRESFYFKSKGPRLFKDDGDVLDIINGMVDIRNPFTPSLGVQIAPEDESSHEGTGALYFRESEASDRILLLTTRHVALPPSRPPNRLYKDPGSRQRDNIIILGDKAYKKAADTMLETLEAQQSRIRRSESFVKSFGEPTEGESPENIKKREHGYTSIAGARWIIKDVNKCQNEIKSWESPENRVIGNVIYSPAISVTSDQCIEDWAMINIDPDVIDLDTFQGNVLYLGMFQISLTKVI